MSAASYDWLRSGEGQAPEFRNSQPPIEKIEAVIGSDLSSADPVIAQRLLQTREVLQSTTPYAAALDANIVAFHRSIQTEKRVARIEKRLGILFHEDIDGEGEDCGLTEPNGTDSNYGR